MTADEFKAQQAKLGLTSAQAAAILRVSIKTIEKWRQGTRSVPGPTIVVLELLDYYKGAVDWLRGRST